MIYGFTACPMCTPARGCSLIPRAQTLPLACRLDSLPPWIYKQLSYVKRKSELNNLALGVFYRTPRPLFLKLYPGYFSCRTDVATARTTEESLFDSRKGKTGLLLLIESGVCAASHLKGK